MRINQKALFVIGSSLLTKSSGFTVRNAAAPIITRSSSLYINQNNNKPVDTKPIGYTTHHHQHHHHHGQQTRLFMNILKDLFQQPEKPAEEEILKAFQNPKAVVIDVRGPAEIITKVDAKNWLNIPGTPFDCPQLSEDAETLLPDKTVPIILHCASGKRSAKAASILKEKGYEQVFNAGGIGEVSYLPVKSVE
jgi:rhodanese-related sulfurtransferase